MSRVVRSLTNARASVQEDVSVPEAVTSLLADTKQPVLFELHGRYYVKVDSNAIPVASA